MLSELVQDQGSPPSSTRSYSQTLLKAFSISGTKLFFNPYPGNIYLHRNKQPPTPACPSLACFRSRGLVSGSFIFPAGKHTRGFLLEQGCWSSRCRADASLLRIAVAQTNSLQLSLPDSSGGALRATGCGRLARPRSIHPQELCSQRQAKRTSGAAPEVRSAAHVCCPPLGCPVGLFLEVPLNLHPSSRTDTERSPLML